ncbi:MAG: V-type ATP synthase subunit E [Clostridia bacterium]
MKGTEKIIAHIRADAEAQSAAILSQAEQQCAAIRADFEAKAKERYNERLLSGEKACEDRVDSMDRIARMEARKGLLALKQEMVSRSFELACEKLVKLPEAEYVALLARLAADAAVTGTEEIVLNARDRAAVGEKAVKAANARLAEAGKPAELKLSPAEGSFAGGLLLRRGSIETNCTAELLVELQRSEMSSELAGVLFD